MTTIPQHPLQNRIPYRLVHEDGQWLCRWLYVGDHRFSEPFFDETIQVCKKHAFNSKPFHSVSTLNDLPVLAKSLPSVPPRAFIFHISRCGSTLLSQLLGMDENTISLAEVPLLDELLQLRRRSPGQEAALDQAFAAAVSACAQKRTGREQHLFVKLDSWHIIFYDVIRRLYPNVPCVLLYRSPAEVLSSHRKHRGMQAVPGVLDPAIFGFSDHEVSGMDLDAYTARVLERYLLAFAGIAARQPGILLINYREGAAAMLEKTLAHAGVSHSRAMLDKMTARSLYHSKHPGQAFAGDKCDTINEQYLRAAMEAYELLEKKRK